MEERRCPYCGRGVVARGVCPVCGRTWDVAGSGITMMPSESGVRADTGRIDEHRLPYHSVLKERYLVGDVLGEGGFGITYEGFDQTLEMRVAIKEYFPVGHAVRNATESLEVTDATFGGDEAFVRGKENFLAEARTMARVGTGDALCGVIDFFEQNGTAYIIMEFVEGKSLENILDERGGKIGFDELLGLVLPVIDALGAMHAVHLVHRDLSPDNIMVSDKGAILIDFGCAREFVGDESESRSMTVMLKYDYAAPEQYGTGGQGPWTDVYGMCAVLYRCLTGQLAPRAPDRLAGDALVAPGDLVAGIPQGASDAIVAGLALRAADRTQSMAELRKGLVSQHAPGPAEPSAPSAPSAATGRKVPVAAVAAVAALAVAAAGAVALLGGETPADLRPPVQTDGQTIDGGDGSLGTAGNPDATDPDGTAGAGGKAMGETSEGGSSTGAIGAAGDSGDAGASDASAERSAEGEGALPRVRLTYGMRTGFAAGGNHTVAILEDGAIKATGSNEYGQCDMRRLSKCVAVAAGVYDTLGLRSDGTVVAVGDDAYGQCKTGSWRGVTSVAAGMGHTVGLVVDGTVVAAGNDEFGQCDVQGWEDIAAVSAGAAHTLGLRHDGTVVAAGDDADGQCDVSGWHDIVALSAGGLFSVGLKADGRVVATGKNDFGQCDVGDWENIAEVSAGIGHVVALGADGRVRAAGLNENGQCDVDGWTDVVWVQAGGYHTLALRSDGTLLATGLADDGQLDVAGWTMRCDDGDGQG